MLEVLNYIERSYSSLPSPSCACPSPLPLSKTVTTVITDDGVSVLALSLIPDRKKSLLFHHVFFS